MTWAVQLVCAPWCICRDELPLHEWAYLKNGIFQPSCLSACPSTSYCMYLHNKQPWYLYTCPTDCRRIKEWMTKCHENLKEHNILASLLSLFHDYSLTRHFSHTDSKSTLFSCDWNVASRKKGHEESDHDSSSLLLWFHFSAGHTKN